MFLYRFQVFRGCRQNTTFRVFIEIGRNFENQTFPQENLILLAQMAAGCENRSEKFIRVAENQLFDPVRFGS